MKKLFIFLFALFIIFSCKQGSTQNNIQLVNDYISSVENLEFEVMGDLLSEDYIGIGPSVGDSVTKKSAVANWKQNVKTLY
ncbi:hypothetical protein [Flammeovirga aprica]|uniref:Nuclear transport factor 2 family protein n=1 Tax=Flammeovirga aprica JL-4 TaxID=694437 RepID=A0A7X9XAF9_9BACT|nr:hypothetical protein [Flammeovirga aprica]NME69611.1 hypothetical protein [Flammeovirga aprica JL-4]